MGALVYGNEPHLVHSGPSHIDMVDSLGLGVA